MFFPDKTKRELKYTRPQQNGAIHEGPAEAFNLNSWIRSMEWSFLLCSFLPFPMWLSGRQFRIWNACSNECLTENLKNIMRWRAYETWLITSWAPDIAAAVFNAAFLASLSVEQQIHTSQTMMAPPVFEAFLMNFIHNDDRADRYEFEESLFASI